jgi:hypothetical protein
MKGLRKTFGAEFAEHLENRKMKSSSHVPGLFQKNQKGAGKLALQKPATSCRGTYENAAEQCMLWGV